MCKTNSKPFVISKKSVWQAYHLVKSNRGGSGVDRVSLKEFEENLRTFRVTRPASMKTPGRRSDLIG
ncbi:hypothetical protein STSP2_02275 [Anaerohalosphaera lusitana]|uniref:Retron-type reverse transcriptase n=1 Tax=Anaerohalosphaera lusitana TaxID=1936003 RepID=A0A1U9NMY3_9BACT|nr:hypothetical protein STSP2_02275 [Anaerohalosphaera lusitana]